MPDNSKQIAIIGGGASGLMAAKNLIDLNLSPVIFEKNTFTGGVWANKADPKSSPGHEELMTNISKRNMSISDYPFPDDTEHFPYWRKVCNYIESYKDHFNLEKVIKYGHTITDLTKTDNGILVEGLDNQNHKYSATFSKVIVCTGLYSKPFYAKIKGIDNYSGKILHSINFDKSSDFKGKKVLVIGYASSAVDIAACLARNDVDTYLSYKSLSLVIPHFFGNRPFDYLISRYTTLLPPWYFTCQFRKNFFRSEKGRTKKLLKDPPIQPEKYKICSSSDFRDLANNGKITIYPEIEGINKETIVFKNHESIKADYIIFATGYTPNFPNLNGFDIPFKGNLPLAYKHIFPVKEKDIAFIGTPFVRGGTFPFYEMQGRYIAHIFGDYTKLPSEREMAADIHKTQQIKKSKNKLYFVEKPIPYMDALAKQIGVFPSYLHKPKFLQSILRGPFCSAQYRINGKAKWKKAKDYIIKGKLQ
ncbi:MAG: flavin-containing monooxygenase [Bacteroidales bacterium]